MASDQGWTFLKNFCSKLGSCIKCDICKTAIYDEMFIILMKLLRVYSQKDHC